MDISSARMPRDAIPMRARIGPATPDRPGPGGVTFRLLDDRDVIELGELMYAAYSGTIDDEGQEPEDHIEVAAWTLAGQFGPVQRGSSFVAAASRSGSLIGATIVTTWQGVPLLAFALVAPEWQNRGVGTALLARSAAALGAAGETEWTLAVTRHNPAIHLYERFGFQEDQSITRRGTGR